MPTFPIDKDDDQDLNSKELTALVKFLEMFVKVIYENAMKDPIVIAFFDFFP